MHKLFAALCYILGFLELLHIGRSFLIKELTLNTRFSLIFACFGVYIYKNRTTVSQAASNVACERIYQTLKHGLWKLPKQKNLNERDAIVPSLMFPYNTSVHSSTGFTPFLLMFREEAGISCEIVSRMPHF